MPCRDFCKEFYILCYIKLLLFSVLDSYSSDIFHNQVWLHSAVKHKLSI